MSRNSSSATAACYSRTKNVAHLIPRIDQARLFRGSTNRAVRDRIFDNSSALKSADGKRSQLCYEGGLTLRASLSCPRNIALFGLTEIASATAALPQLPKRARAPTGSSCRQTSRQCKKSFRKNRTAASRQAGE